MEAAIKTLIILALSSFTVTAAAQLAPFNGPPIWDNYAALPQYQDWEWMYASAEEIADDLNSSGGKYILQYKPDGGSSHQTYVKRAADGSTMGIWSAPNHATYVEGEIFAFHLARLLNRSEWVTPGIRMTLTGPGREMAYNANNYANTRSNRLCDRDTILAHMNNNPYFITGVYKAFIHGVRPTDVPELVDGADGKRLKQSHFLVDMIYKDGARPTGRQVYLVKEGKTQKLSYSQDGQVVATANDRDLAKQLSFMMLVDALNSQRDRFGPYGSNMQALLYQDIKEFALAAIDNGGVADASDTISLRFLLGRYTNGRSVSRVEKDVMDNIIAMDDFIQGKRRNFQSFSSPDELKRALGYEAWDSYDVRITMPSTCKSDHSWLMNSTKTRWDKRYRAFTNALKAVAEHLRTIQNDPEAVF